MIDELRRQLSEHAALVERQKKIDAMLQSLRQEEHGLLQRERELKYALHKEEADVDRLERTTATSILYSLLGKKETTLKQEQREAYAAKLKYDAAVSQLDDCRLRINKLQIERDGLDHCKEDYKAVFLKLKALLQEIPIDGEKLFALEQQYGDITGQLQELDEAIGAGNAAMEQIRNIENSLSSAESWGTWDLMGGGMISDIAKHSRLDEAQAGAERLQILLSRFRTELADVYISAEMGAVNIDGFLRFADYFFDGLIADWSVLSRIQQSQDSVYQVKQQVQSALWKLDNLKTARLSELSAIKKEIEEYISGK